MNNIMLIEWLMEHKQAYEDCKYYFGVDDLGTIDSSYIYNWICEHPSLFTDFVNYFGYDTVQLMECNMDNQKFMEMINEMIERVEDMLFRYDIEIPNEEKKEIDGASNIYGTDYSYLSDMFEEILRKYNVIERDYNEGGN